MIGFDHYPGGALSCSGITFTGAMIMRWNAVLTLYRIGHAILVFLGLIDRVLGVFLIVKYKGLNSVYNKLAIDTTVFIERLLQKYITSSP